MKSYQISFLLQWMLYLCHSPLVKRMETKNIQVMRNRISWRKFLFTSHSLPRGQQPIRYYYKSFWDKLWGSCNKAVLFHNFQQYLTLSFLMTYSSCLSKEGRNENGHFYRYILNVIPKESYFWAEVLVPTWCHPLCSNCNSDKGKILCKRDAS